MAGAAGLGLPEAGGAGRGTERAAWRVLAPGGGGAAAAGGGGPPVICVFVPEGGSSSGAGPPWGKGGLRRLAAAGGRGLRTQLESAARAACVAGAMAAGTWAAPLAAAGLVGATVRAARGQHKPVVVPRVRAAPPAARGGPLSREGSAEDSPALSGETAGSRVYARALPRTTFPAPAQSGLPVAELTIDEEGGTAWSGASGGPAPSPLEAKPENLPDYPPGLTPARTAEHSAVVTGHPEGSHTWGSPRDAASIGELGSPGPSEPLPAVTPSASVDDADENFAAKAFDALVDVLQVEGLEQWDEWEDCDLFKLPDTASDGERFYAALSCLRDMWASKTAALQESIARVSKEVEAGERTVREMSELADEFTQAHEAEKSVWLEEKAAWLEEKAVLQARVFESRERCESAQKEAKLVTEQAEEERRALDELLSAEQQETQTYVEAQTRMYEDSLVELETELEAMKTTGRALIEENDALRSERDQCENEVRKSGMVTEALEAEVSTQALKNETLEKEIEKIEADHRLRMQVQHYESAKKVKAMENSVADYEQRLNAIRVDAAQFVTPKKELIYSSSGEDGAGMGARRQGLRTAFRAKNYITGARAVRERYFQADSPESETAYPMNAALAEPLQDDVDRISVPGAAPAKTPLSDRPLSAKSPPMMDITNSQK